jgi:hypothetical protein
MTKLLAFTFITLLGVSLAFGQDTGGSTDKQSGNKGKQSGKKATKTKTNKKVVKKGADTSK